MCVDCHNNSSFRLIFYTKKSQFVKYVRDKNRDKCTILQNNFLLLQAWMQTICFSSAFYFLGEKILQWTTLTNHKHVLKSFVLFQHVDQNTNLQKKEARLPKQRFKNNVIFKSKNLLNISKIKPFDAANGF